MSSQWRREQCWKKMHLGRNSWGTPQFGTIQKMAQRNGYLAKHEYKELLMMHDAPGRTWELLTTLLQSTILRLYPQVQAATCIVHSNSKSRKSKYILLLLLNVTISKRILKLLCLSGKCIVLLHSYLVCWPCTRGTGCDWRSLLLGCSPCILIWAAINKMLLRALSTKPHLVHPVPWGSPLLWAVWNKTIAFLSSSETTAAVEVATVWRWIPAKGHSCLWVPLANLHTKNPRHALKLHIYS